MKVKVDWEREDVVISFSPRWVISIPLAQAKRLQQLLQAELGVPADLKVAAKRRKRG